MGYLFIALVLAVAVGIPAAAHFLWVKVIGPVVVLIVAVVIVVAGAIGAFVGMALWDGLRRRVARTRAGGDTKFFPPVRPLRDAVDMRGGER